MYIILGDNIFYGQGLTNLLARSVSKQGLKIACVEEIAFDKKYISKEQLRDLENPLSKNEYGGIFDENCI